MTEVKLTKKRYQTDIGEIVYWVSESVELMQSWLVFLPGLTADHRLFEKQVEHFAPIANVLVWDPPSHGESRPFELRWSLDDLATWLHDIFQTEGIASPVLVGQSMGGYVAQAYMRLFPDKVSGFVSIDSCPLEADYYQGWELYFLRHTKLMYLSIPWKVLQSLGVNGCATSEYGRHIMHNMMDGFEKREYCALAAHGFQVLAEAISPNRDYALPCPTLLLCGVADHAGSAKRYNRNWSRRTGLPLHWVEGAGHNSNTDKPEIVNELIEKFACRLSKSVSTK